MNLKVVIKHNGEVIRIDTDKIAAAIISALEAIRPALEQAVQNITGALGAFADTLKETVAPLFANASRIACTVLHDFLHWILQGMRHIRERITIAFRFKPQAVIFINTSCQVKFKALMIRFLDHYTITRRALLFRPQHRGSDDTDDSNNDYCINQAILTFH